MHHSRVNNCLWLLRLTLTWWAQGSRWGNLMEAPLSTNKAWWKAQSYVSYSLTTFSWSIVTRCVSSCIAFLLLCRTKALPQKAKVYSSLVLLPAASALDRWQKPHAASLSQWTESGVLSMAPCVRSDKYRQETAARLQREVKKKSHSHQWCEHHYCGCLSKLELSGFENWNDEDCRWQGLKSGRSC